MDRMGEQATMEYNIVLKLGAFVGGFLSGFVNTNVWYIHVYICKYTYICPCVCGGEGVVT